MTILTNDEYFVRDVRLPRHVVPDHYDLELQPIIKEENFTTFGSVVLTFTVSEEETLSPVSTRPLLFHGRQPNNISLSSNFRPHFSCLLSILNLHKRSEQSKHSQMKGIKKGHKIFWPSVYGWEGMHLSVCVSVLIEKMKCCQR